MMKRTAGRSLEPNDPSDLVVPKPAGLSLSNIQEIWNVFDAFDDDRLGRLSVSKATIACRALGFQVTQNEVESEMKALKGNQEFVDFDRMCRFLQNRNFHMRDAEYELRTTFDLLDVSKKGYITEQDLQQVVEEVYPEDERCMNVHQMIECFDSDKDGCINFNDFKRIMTRGNRSGGYSPE